MDTRMMSTIRRCRAVVVGSAVALAILASSAVASAETLLMPKRDFSTGVSEVVWGVTTQLNGTAYTIDFGDGSAPVAGNVADRSYIAFNHTYALSGTFTVTLTVGAEVATVDVNVYNHSLLSVSAIRDLRINKAIQDGLRYLWYSQNNRAANFPASVTTDWTFSFHGFPGAYTSLVVLAFENHGYRLPNNNSAPTGIYEKYVVRRGLNFILNTLSTFTLSSQATGNPCVVYEASPCTGLRLNQDGFHEAYETPLAILPLAASGAMNRTVGEIAGTGSGGFVVGKTYAEILQRMVNSVAYGQIDISTGRGGWYYNFNIGNSSSDGSTVGWVMLALLDARSAGATVPAYVKTEWSAANQALANALNNDGSFDYQSDGNRASNNSVNVAKTGVGLQGMFFADRPLANADVQNALNWINARWAAPSGESFLCSGGISNKGCGYGMFNVFKGLKLFNVATLPSVNRVGVDWNGNGTPDVVGDVDDWHADYEDWLVVNQTSPQTTTAGNWGPLVFSSQVNGHEPAETALGLLILAPVALVLPDPTLFSTVGLSPPSATNPPGTSHIVIARTLATNKAPIPGATVTFRVIAGPNVGKTGSDVTDAAGEAHFTYNDTSVAPHGTDQIQAFVGSLESNIVTKTWQLAVGRCDVEPDGDVDEADLAVIQAARGKKASGPNDPRDGNGDGTINVADYRYCALRLTPATAAAAAPAPAPAAAAPAPAKAAAKAKAPAKPKAEPKPKAPAPAKKK